MDDILSIVYYGHLAEIFNISSNWQTAEQRHSTGEMGAQFFVAANEFEKKYILGTNAFVILYPNIFQILKIFNYPSSIFYSLSPFTLFTSRKHHQIKQRTHLSDKGTFFM